VKETRGILKITMNFPRDRAELARILKTTRIFYSYDKYSSINAEALRCGACVKIITQDGFEDFTRDGGWGNVDEKIFDSELDYFIEKTQNMHYDGPVESLDFSLKRIVFSLKNIVKEVLRKTFHPYSS
jgi:hypothetical protein